MVHVKTHRGERIKERADDVADEGRREAERRVHGQRQVREWFADGRGSEDAGDECGGMEVAM